MEKKIQHLQMIQGVINRMASNSFMLKGWAVTLVAGVFALASKETDGRYFLIAFIPILVFWGLDSYYLLQERLYRYLYKEVLKKSENEIDFSLNAEVFKPSKTARQSNSLSDDDKKLTYPYCLFSVTELGLYLPLATICFAVVLGGVLLK